MKKIFPASSPGTDILPQLNSSCKNDSHSHSRLNIWESPKQVCPHCGSGNLKIGAGLKPGEESRRCNDCKHFLGYSPLAKLKKARKRKELTNCLEILESQDIRGDLAIFILSLASDGSEVDV